MPSRSYRQFCPLARSLDLLGERWTLLVVRDLLLGPKRFTDLAGALSGIAPNLLAARLRALESAGVARRRTLPPPAAATVYELTDRGRELEPAVLALARWGRELLDAPRAGDAFRPGWLLLSLRALARPERALGVRESYELRVEGDVLSVRVDDGAVEAAEGPAADPAVVIHADRDAFLELACGLVAPAEALAGGRVRIDGDEAALLRSLAIMAPAG